MSKKPSKPEDIMNENSNEDDNDKNMITNEF
jgi:hypothetical protein